MSSYEILVGQNVYTIFENKVYKGFIEKTCYKNRKKPLIVKWCDPIEGVIPKKENVESIDQEYSPRDIGEKIWFRISDVCTV